MKKLFSIAAAALFSMAAMAADYTERLQVFVNGQSMSDAQQVISVDKQSDSKYTLTLKDFSIKIGGFPVNVGTIKVDADAENLNDGKVLLTANQNVTISLGPVPVELTGKVDEANNDLYAVLNINYNGMVIKVLIGDGYQIPNSDFELFHTESFTSSTGEVSKSCDEANFWHSFMSSTGDFSEAVKGLGDPHTFISEDKRPGSNGSKSLLVKSGAVFGITANGTVTTGRMQAGAMFATDTKNCAFLDLSYQEKDANGDPFYVIMNGQPDSLVVWVKFKQGTPDSKNPYATVAANITDGTYFQDPQDKEYHNVLAKAANVKIESKDEWQRIAVPFDYDTYAADKVNGKAILVTLSTNATPGGGSATDELYIDDLSLVYNAALTSLKINGKELEGFNPATTEYTITTPVASTNDIEATTNGHGAIVKKTVSDNDVLVTVISNDLSTSTTYTLKGALSGISSVHATTNGQDAIYTLNGVKVNNTNTKGLYIIRKADGTTVKRLK